jgi:hypothetical protein
VGAVLLGRLPGGLVAQTGRIGDALRARVAAQYRAARAPAPSEAPAPVPTPLAEQLLAEQVLAERVLAERGQS